MNILILQGSPRANGNTAWVAQQRVGLFVIEKRMK
jgi:hypothetical protein